MKFSAGAVSSLVTATADAPLVALRAPAAEQMRVREIGVFMVAATATRLGLARATSVSVTPGTTKPGRNNTKGGPDSGSLLVNSWGTVPAISVNYLRRIGLPAAIGAGFIWTWPADDPLIVGDGAAISEVCLANLVAVACSTFDWYACWED